MKAGSLCLLLPLLFLMLLAASPSFAERRAAIISFSQYPWADLPGVRADRKIIRPLLEKDYRVTLFDDRMKTKREFRRAWAEFVETIKPKDEVVVYYGGHGIDIEGTNYLIPLDAEAPDASTTRLKFLSDEFILLRTLIEEVQERDPTFTVFLLDACRTNPYASRGAGSSPRGLRPEAIERFGGYLLVLFSAEFNQEAKDSMPKGDVNGGSPFALMFAKLYDEGKSVSIMYFFQLVSAAVQEAVSPGDQLPTMQGMAPPTWCFAECKGAASQQIVIASVVNRGGVAEKREVVTNQTNSPDEDAKNIADDTVNKAVKDLGNVVYLGKLSERECLGNRASGDIPFGCEFLKEAMAVISANGSQEAFNIVPRAVYDVNVRRSPPTVKGTRAYYDCRVRILKHGEDVKLKKITAYQYANDTFLWGVVDEPQLDKCQGI